MKPRGAGRAHTAFLDDLTRRVAQRQGSLSLTGLRGGARRLVAAELVRANPDRPILIVAGGAKLADRLLADLRTLLGEPLARERLVAFPRHDTLPFERFSPEPFVVASRMAALYRWLARGLGPAPVVVAPWTALALRVPSRALVRSRTVHIEIGMTIDRDALIERLVGAGYSRMGLVEERGELAVRGGVLDVFPPHARFPLRIEMLGDEVESLRDFDPASQRSQEKRASAVLPPTREILFDRSTVVKRADELRAHAREQSAPDAECEQVIDSLLRGALPPGAEALAPLIQPDLETVFDYLGSDALIALDEPAAGRDRIARYAEDAARDAGVARDAGRWVCDFQALALTPDEIERELASRRAVSLCVFEPIEIESPQPSVSLETRDHADLRRELARTRAHERALSPLIDAIAEWRHDELRVSLLCPSLSGAERLRHLLGEYGVETRLAFETQPRPAMRWAAHAGVEIRVGELSEGFVWPNAAMAVVTEEEIFGPREKRRHTQASWLESAAIEGIAALAPGDHLVHKDHGIGIYRGLQILAAARGRPTQEMLCIEYAGGDKLFLPVDRLSKVQRYAGAEDVAVRVDRLGGQTWEKAKSRVRRSLRDMARELVSMHAARELAKGFSYSPRDAYFEEFEAAFPYEETPGQHAAIEEVLGDLQRPKPMDRLVCGDVGYGKTEVAIRAAFRVVMDGRQVAVLIPTTVLCQQHTETFRKRFEGYPVRVASLSRFCSAAEAKEVCARLAAGEIDVVIGTHRLLQKNVSFRDLGLLVVDEEHRFGVAHKERIKKLRESVDVLTLTATPIPRTLQMALTGIRDLSVIDTPPVDRLAVRTQVCRFSEKIIREAILRELSRGGQVFFVHNRVHSIDGMRELLERSVPEARVLVAHGQMKERELEERMLAFMRGEADVLLCTTIIESGIDIPRANTILINRAHALGLAQLYQLRGRVGRSEHRAYAFLLVPHDALTADAERRLDAIQELSELGSGFRLANMDLEIRGAGNLLGAEQSGNLGAVGFDTYMEMLAAAVEELRGHAPTAEIDPEIRLPVEARLPEELVPEVSQRLVLYKRLASSRDDDEVDRIRDEILDRFGSLPDAAANLLEVIRIKLRAKKLGIVGVDLARGELMLTVSAQAAIDPKRLVSLLGESGRGIRISPDHRIFAPAPAEGGTACFGALRELFAQLGG